MGSSGFTFTWKARWALGIAGMKVLSSCGLLGGRLDGVSSKGGGSSPRGQALAYQASFSNYVAKLITEDSPGV